MALAFTGRGREEVKSRKFHFVFFFSPHSGAAGVLPARAASRLGCLYYKGCCTRLQLLARRLDGDAMEEGKASLTKPRKRSGFQLFMARRGLNARGAAPEWKAISTKAGTHPSLASVFVLEPCLAAKCRSGRGGRWKRVQQRADMPSTIRPHGTSEVATNFIFCRRDLALPRGTCRQRTAGPKRQWRCLRRRVAATS